MHKATAQAMNIIAPDSNPDARTLLASLRGVICPSDGRPKQAGQSLCGRCYHSLPAWQQRALYRLIGDGYAEALNTALGLLRDCRRDQDRESGKAGQA
jgi:hypothetical protein